MISFNSLIARFEKLAALSPEEKEAQSLTRRGLYALRDHVAQRREFRASRDKALQRKAKGADITEGREPVRDKQVPHPTPKVLLEVNDELLDSYVRENNKLELEYLTFKLFSDAKGLNGINYYDPDVTQLRRKIYDPLSTAEDIANHLRTLIHHYNIKAIYAPELPAVKKRNTYIDKVPHWQHYEKESPEDEGDEYITISHGGGYFHILEFVTGTSPGYRLEQPGLGIQVSPDFAAFRRDEGYAFSGIHSFCDHPATFSARIKRRYLDQANLAYEAGLRQPFIDLLEDIHIKRITPDNEYLSLITDKQNEELKDLTEKVSAIVFSLNSFFGIFTSDKVVLGEKLTELVSFLEQSKVPIEQWLECSPYGLTGIFKKYSTQLMTIGVERDNSALIEYSLKIRNATDTDVEQTIEQVIEKNRLVSLQALVTAKPENYRFAFNYLFKKGDFKQLTVLLNLRDKIPNLNRLQLSFEAIIDRIISLVEPKNQVEYYKILLNSAHFTKENFNFLISKLIRNTTPNGLEEVIAAGKERFYSGNETEFTADALFWLNESLTTRHPHAGKQLLPILSLDTWVQQTIQQRKFDSLQFVLANTPEEQLPYKTLYAVYSNLLTAIKEGAMVSPTTVLPARFFANELARAFAHLQSQLSEIFRIDSPKRSDLFKAQIEILKFVETWRNELSQLESIPAELQQALHTLLHGPVDSPEITNKKINVMYLDAQMKESSFFSNSPQAKQFLDQFLGETDSLIHLLGDERGSTVNPQDKPEQRTVRMLFNQFRQGDLTELEFYSQLKNTYHANRAPNGFWSYLNPVNWFNGNIGQFRRASTLNQLAKEFKLSLVRSEATPEFDVSALKVRTQLAYNKLKQIAPETVARETPTYFPDHAELVPKTRGNKREKTLTFFQNDNKQVQVEEALSLQQRADEQREAKGIGKL